MTMGTRNDGTFPSDNDKEWVIDRVPYAWLSRP
jgi:hypothetical protein